MNEKADYTFQDYYKESQADYKSSLRDAIKRFAKENPKRFAELQAQALHELEHPPERSVIKYPTLTTGRLDIDKIVSQFRAGRRDYYVHTKDTFGDVHLYFETLTSETEAIEVMTKRHPKFTERNEEITKVEPCVCPLCK